MALGISAERASCPGSEFHCNSTGNFPAAEPGYPVQANPLLAVPSIFSSTLSCLGCIVIVYTYCRWKDIRTGSRAVITFLSIADFFTAFGYIIGSLNYSLTFYKTTHRTCALFTYICQIQSFVTSSSSLSSFFWTVTLAIYLYVSLVQNKPHVIQKWFPLFHVFNWGFPVLLLLGLLSGNVLGYSYLGVSTWCFIGRNPKKWQSSLFVLVGGKLWEIIVYLLVIIIYILIKRHINIQTEKGVSSKSLNAGLIAVLKRSDKKLIAIPIVFVLLRCWGTFHWIYSLAVQHQIHHGCTSKSIYGGFVFFSVLQAIGDGGQGWGNLILYVMVSDRIRKRLFGCCLRANASNNLNHLDKSSSEMEQGHAINYGTIQDTEKVAKNRSKMQEEVTEPTTTMS